MLASSIAGVFGWRERRPEPRARALQETAQRAQRSKWDEAITDDVIQFAVKCLESAAKALQGVGSELGGRTQLISGLSVEQRPLLTCC